MIMKTNVWIFVVVFCLTHTLQIGYAANPIDSLTNVAEQFVKIVDANDAEQLKPLLHPEMVQFVQLGSQLIPFKTADFIQMVADKKIGGKPRDVEVLSANILRGQTAEVRIRAVSDEYDFMYQLAMAKNGSKWIITGVLAEIRKV